MGSIDSNSRGTGDLPPNINRYFVRTIDMDLAHGGKTNFVYSKLGRFIILGFINDDRPARWKDTKIHLKTGRVEPRTYKLPSVFIEYLKSRARYMLGTASSISLRQATKIDQALLSNIEKFTGSDAFVALQNDVRMFGDASFTGDYSCEADKDLKAKEPKKSS
jgi:hypothetical protein